MTSNYTRTRYEQETIFNYNQEEKTASIYTHDPSLIRKMDKLASEDAAVTVVREGDGWREYSCPKKYIKVRAPRKLSDEQRAEMAERMKSMRKEQDDE